ncbi:MAG: peptidyl-prolyl cis-trans isomerase [Endozoicomonadaceae bacterium]|nr:peptidyl-prolyl cis-trans isomerase [Endozoicomonadaceae bacterium]
MIAVLETSMGTIKIELNTEKAPNTTKNFIDYIKANYYDGTIFHRVINGFMIQGGGMDADMTEKTTQNPIKNEANNGLLNEIGSVAMARTNDPHSATAQFFINIADNSFLNFKSENESGWGYAVFGKVTDGMDVVNQIKSVKTGSKNHHTDVPVEPITIIKATLTS